MKLVGDTGENCGEAIQMLVSAVFQLKLFIRFSTFKAFAAEAAIEQEHDMLTGMWKNPRRLF